MASVDLRVAAILRQKVQADLEIHFEQITDGKPQDFGAYRYEVGYIAALRSILALWEESERETIGER